MYKARVLLPQAMASRLVIFFKAKLEALRLAEALIGCEGYSRYIIAKPEARVQREWRGTGYRSTLVLVPRPSAVCFLSPTTLTHHAPIVNTTAHANCPWTRLSLVCEDYLQPHHQRPPPRLCPPPSRLPIRQNQCVAHTRPALERCTHSTPPTHWKPLVCIPRLEGELVLPCRALANTHT